MKVNFLLKGKNDPTKLVCRFKPTQENDFSATTDFIVYRGDWHIKYQKIKLKTRLKTDLTEVENNQNLTREDINLKIAELREKITNQWNLDKASKKDINTKWLKILLSDYFNNNINFDNHKKYFTDWISKFIEDAPKRLNENSQNISPKTIQQYSVTHKKILAFEKHKSNENKDKEYKIKFKDIDLEFRTDFINYCRTTERLGDNSINGHIKNIKMWCKNIDFEGLPISKHFMLKEFKGIKAETKDIYLNDKEINKIFNHDFKEDLRLSNTRDHFIFGLRTGLRISDFLQLSEKNIDKKNITIVTQKTKQKVIIPIHPQVKQILLKRNGELPTPLSDQKFNEYVKEVCKAVGINEKVEGAKTVKIITKEKTKTTPEEYIYRKVDGIYQKWELTSSHVCRRSFATLLYGKLPNKTIMAITGHNSEAQFIQYVKTTNEEHAEILADFWNEDKPAIEDKKSDLRAV